MANKKYKVVILKNESLDDHFQWIHACEAKKEKIEYRVVDLTSYNWLFQIQKEEFDVLLLKPGGITSSYKQLYDERVYILAKVLNFKTFPSLNEVLFYENKRFLSYFLQANQIPHPTTTVFYKSTEASEFILKTKFPVIAKSNIGASGSGVKKISSYKEAVKYINQTYNGNGAQRRIGPNFNSGGLFKRGLHYIINPLDVFKKLKLYKTIKSDKQKDFVIFQQYIDHEFEWRVVRIGNSFFAHKKIKVADKASGSLIKGYINPPLSLLTFVKNITDSHSLYSQAVDVFESSTGYLVNEMQCIFGQSDEYQMLINGMPGRYLFINNSWQFEPGDFAKNSCYDLRIEYLLESLPNK